jgi:hypothetical protein
LIGNQTTYRRVSVGMTSEIPRLAECPAAVLTLERFLTGVYPLKIILVRSSTLQPA